MIQLLVRFHILSLKNRTLSRIRRLRQIRYLVGTAVAIAYFAFLLRPRGGGGILAALSFGRSLDSDVKTALLMAGAAFLTALMLIAWIWPGRTAALHLSEAEITFLFASPLTRRQVIDYSLLKAQVGIIFGVVVTSLILLRHLASSITQALIGAWILFTFTHLYLTAVAIVRTNFFRHGWSGLRRAWPALSIGAVVLISLAVGIQTGSLRMPTSEDAGNLKDYVIETGEAPPLGWLLWPGRALLQPMAARGAGSFLLSLLPALGLLALSYIWVIRSDFRYEEASAEAAARKADRKRLSAAGSWRERGVSVGARRTPFRLASRGSPLRALVWKNLVAIWRLTPWPVALLIFATGAIASLVFSGALRSAAPGQTAVGIGLSCVLLATFLTFFGPEWVRSDLRLNLPHANLLKSYPVKGSTLMLAEISGCAAVTTLSQALLLAAGLPLLHGFEGWSVAEWALMAAGALLLAAPVNLLIVLVQNAAVLLFPAWHHLGPGRPQGIAVMGQTLVSMLLRVLAFAVTILPAALILILGIYLLHPLTGLPVALLLAALAAAVPVIVEAWAGIVLLGLLFERFDPSRELDIVI
jgi:hypothetical protein